MVANDYRRVITADDLIRQYDLNNLKKDRNNIKEAKKELENQNKLIQNFADSVTKDITNLQNQVDGNITTWFFSGIPTLDNEPAINWTSEKEKINHIGDLYYDKETGYAYRFTQENNVFSWIKISDSDITEALSIANSAQDTADKKRQVFVTSPSPPYDVGDLWIKEDKELYRCRAKRTSGNFQEVDWCKATDYSNDDYAKGVEAVLNSFKTTVESDYATKVQLETTKDSIVENVESATTVIEEKIIGVQNQVTEQGIDVNNKLQDINNNFDNYETVENVKTINQKMEELQTSAEWSVTHIEEIQENGVSQVVTENGMSFNKDGLHLDRNGANTGLNLDEKGMEVVDKTGSSQSTQLFSGYVTQELADKNPILAPYIGQTITFTKNMYVGNYLEMQNGRWENVEHEVWGKGIGLFIGGDN